MIELMINCRFTEPQEYIQLEPDLEQFPPASELRYKCITLGL